MKTLIFLATLFSLGIASGNETPKVDSVRFLKLDGKTSFNRFKDPKKYDPSVVEIKIKNIEWQSYSKNYELYLTWSLSGKQCLEFPNPDGTLSYSCQSGNTESLYIDLTKETRRDRNNYFGDQWRAKIVAADLNTATIHLIVNPDWTGRSKEKEFLSVEQLKIDTIVLKETGKDDIEIEFDDGDITSQNSINLKPLQ